jgi:hypothetical protein
MLVETLQKNQVVIHGAVMSIDGVEQVGDAFQSYTTIIAFRDAFGRVFLDAGKWNYSQTTGKYRNQFLEEGIAVTRKKIESGEYLLADLNN